MTAYKNSREEGSDQEASGEQERSPAQPWLGALGSPAWAWGAQGHLGNAGVLDRIAGGGQFDSGGTGLSGLSLWGRGPDGGAGFGADSLYKGRTTGSFQETANDSGGLTDTLNLARTAYGVDGLSTGWNLGGFGQALSGDLAYNRNSLTGNATRDAAGNVNGLNFDASRTPYSGHDLKATQSLGPLGTTSVGAEDAFLDRKGVRGNAAVGPDGTYRADGSYYEQSGFEHGSVGAHNFLGDTSVSGSFDKSETYSGGLSYNPSTGAAEARGGFGGGGYKISDVDAKGSYLGGNLGLNGHLGEYNTDDTYKGAAGWDPKAQQAYANGYVNTGWDLKNAALGVDLAHGALGANATVSNASYGSSLHGDMRIGADGVHLSTPDTQGLTGDDGTRFGGYRMNDAALSGHLGDFAHANLGAQHVSNDTVLDKAHLDLTGNGINGGFQELRTGGIRAQGVSGGGDLFGQTERFTAGELSNDVDLKGGNVQIDGTGVHSSLDSLRAGGMRALNVTGDQHFLGTDSHISAADVSNDTILKGAYANTNFTGTKGSAGFNTLDTGGLRVDDLKGSFDNKTLGVNGSYGGSFSSMNTVDGAKADWDMTSLDSAHLDAYAKHLAVGPGWTLSNAKADVNGPLGSNAHASIDDLHNGLDATDVRASMDLHNGIQASAGSARYDVLGGKNLNASADLGALYQAKMHIGEGSYNHFAGQNLKAGLDANGLSASGDNLAYNYLGFNDVQMSNSQFGGMMGSHLNAGSLRGAGADVGHLDYSSNGLNTNLTAQNVHAYGLDAQNLDVGTQLAGASLDAKAKQLSALDLHVGDVSAHTGMGGLNGNASVRDAQLDLLNIQGGHAGLGYKGTELVGASGDYRSGGGVQNANANWDLTAGTAAAQFQNAHFGQQLSNASLNVLGSNIALPSAGYNVNANGGGAVDLSKGTANGNLSLAGSSANFAGHEITLGDWAQASGAADLSQGAANANLGGKNGVSAGVNLSHGAANLGVGGENGIGANMDLSKGQLDVNLLGTHIDVAKGAKDAWDYATSW